MPVQNSHDPQALPPLSNFLPPLTLINLAYAATASVSSPAAAFAAVYSTVAIDSTDAVALVSPVFCSFRCVDVVACMDTIFRIYCWLSHSYHSYSFYCVTYYKWKYIEKWIFRYAPSLARVIPSVRLSQIFPLLDFFLFVCALYYIPSLPVMSGCYPEFVHSARQYFERFGFPKVWLKWIELKWVLTPIKLDFWVCSCD